MLTFSRTEFDNLSKNCLMLILIDRVQQFRVDADKLISKPKFDQILLIVHCLNLI